MVISPTSAQKEYLVAQLDEALCCKLDGCGFISCWGEWNSGRTMALELTSPLTEISPGIYLGGTDGLCVGLISLPPNV